jgi:hypothetical protein
MSQVCEQSENFSSSFCPEQSYDLVLQALQMEEDEKIASTLQYNERQRCGHQANRRQFTMLETQIYDNNQDNEEDYDESEDEKENVYDRFQLDEDKEISSVVPKREGKNGNNLPLHHKIYPSKNKGKFMDKTIMLSAQKNKSTKKKELPFKTMDGVDIGLINNWFGNRRGAIYCWNTGATLSCHTLKSACRKSRKIPSRGDIVYFRTRPYQSGIVDILSLVEDPDLCESYQETLKLITRDPIVFLQKELLYQIFLKVGITYHMYKRVSSKWNNVLCQVMDGPLIPSSTKT